MSKLSFPTLMQMAFYSREEGRVVASPDVMSSELCQEVRFVNTI